MAQAPPAGAGADDARQDDHHPEIDWIAAEDSPEFKELIAKRRAFVLPATIFFFVWYFGFILLAGYFPDFMGTSLIGGFTIGYALALTQFLMTFVLGAMYLKRADRDFDPLSRRAAETALEAGRRKAAGGASAPSDGRGEAGSHRVTA